MGLAQDLLRQADHLTEYEGIDPSQASLRRAVSTAYYALFHLLVEEGALRWTGSPEGRIGFERGFNHGSMRTISEKFARSVWKDWHAKVPTIPKSLKEVALAFMTLQDQRHKADYNNSHVWTVTDAKNEIKLAERAFEAWESIRTDSMAGNYLLAMLLGKARV